MSFMASVDVKQHLLESEGETDRQTEAQTDRQTETKTDKQRETRQTDRDRDRDTEREMYVCITFLDMLPSIFLNSHLTQKILENVVQRGEFVYTREQLYTKAICYYN